MRLALRSSVFPNPLVPMTMNLSSRSRLRKLSISGVRCSNASSRSSATRMSSASTVHARMSSSRLAGRKLEDKPGRTGAHEPAQDVAELGGGREDWKVSHSLEEVQAGIGQMLGEIVGRAQRDA